MPDSFRPLAGVKVVDISHVIAGPFATLQLALLGADVTKIEGPAGDVMRNSGGGAEAFVALNGPKAKLRLDLAQPGDRSQALALCHQADVFVDNLRPGSLDRLGLGYAAVSAVNPRIVYCSISGFGRRSASRPAYDHVVQCATGMALATGASGDPPTKIAFPVIDAASGMLAAFAILAGLRERDRTGRGQLLDVSMAGAALQLMYPATCAAMTSGAAPQRTGNRASSGSPGADVFVTADGTWIATAANTPQQLARLLDVLGLGALLKDATLFEQQTVSASSATFARAKDPAAVNARLHADIAGRDRSTLYNALLTVGVPAAQVDSLPDYLRDAEREGLIEPITLTDEGVAVRTPGLGFRITPYNGARS